MSLIDTDYFQSQMQTLGLKSSFTPPAEVLAVLLGEASDWVEGYCRRKFGAQQLTEAHWGKGRVRLILNEYPIATVVSISAENRSGTAADAPAVNDVRITAGGLLELKDQSAVWYTDRLYTVAYTIPDPVPGPVRRATALKVAELLDPQYFPGRTKNAELMTNVQEQIVTLLEDFRRERLG